MRVAVQTILMSPVPMVVLWGKEGTLIYNQGYAEVCGPRHPDALGRGVLEVWPEAADFNARVLAEGLAGRGLRFHDQPLTLLRKGEPEQVWMDLEYSPILDEEGAPVGVLALVVDTTERVLSERRIAESEALYRFLDILSRSTNALTDADEVLAETTRLVGEHLDISNCAYADMDADEDGFTIRGNWHKPDVPSILGHYSLAAFGRLAVEELHAGRPLVINDNVQELAPAEAKSFQDIGIRATICMPLIKDGRLAALMAIHDDRPHNWSDAELNTIREVTERSWAHVQRAASEAEVRATADALSDLYVDLKEETAALEVLNQTAAFIAAEQDLDKIVQSVTDAGVELSGAEFGAFFYNVVDDQNESYMLYTLSGVPRAAFGKFPMPRNTAVFAPTFGGEGVVRSDDIKADPRYGKNSPRKGMPEGHLPVTSYLAVPVMTRAGEVLGGLFFGHSDAARFTERHERLVTGLAAQAAVAIENSRLLSEVQTANERLEQRIAERTVELTQANEALRQSQKMEAVGQLTGGLAHDFNNLLTGIGGGLQMIKARLAQGRVEEIDRYASLAQGAVERAAAVTHRLLAFSRRQTLDPKPTNVPALVEEMRELIARTVGPEIALRVSGEQDIWPVLVDPNQLENAILNLCINARDAMPDGGALTIRILNCPRETESDQVVIEVRDTGSGMDPEVLSKAFDPFFTTKPLGEGTGLGLSMIYGFARQSGGEVVIESEVGVGTGVWLKLPRLVGATPSEKTLKPSGTRAAAGSAKGTLLVVDDEPTVRELVVESLHDAGFKALEAAEGQTALQLLQTNAAIDILITDVGLPGGLNGRQLAEAARAVRPALKVLFITGYAEQDVLAGVQENPGFQVMTKPFDMADLVMRAAAMSASA